MVRDATPEDAQAIAVTHIACWQEAYVDQLPQDFLDGLSDGVERRREFWEAGARAPGDQEALLVAEVAGDVVGFAHIRPSRDALAEETTGELSAIYLRKSYWGRGIGRRLLTEATDRLRACRFRDATLWVLDTNERTRRFYEAAGWVLDGSEQPDQIGDTSVREVRYRVTL